MRTVFPKEPTQDFNEWIGYIKSEINKSNGVKVEKCLLRFCDSDIIDGEWVKSCNECQHYQYAKGSPWFI